ncbi:MAG: hypothetical protein ACI4DW_13300 [Lachnospiraceae bacterium]
MWIMWIDKENRVSEIVDNGQADHEKSACENNRKRSCKNKKYPHCYVYKKSHKNADIVDKLFAKQ